MFASLTDVRVSGYADPASWVYPLRDADNPVRALIGTTSARSASNLMMSRDRLCP